MDGVFHHTQALCPQCGAKVTARVIEDGGKVYLQKFCPVHGLSRVLISSDSAWYRESLRYVKPKQEPLRIHTKEFRGCPQSCGSCPEHQQHTCLPVIEITSECDLACPVCLKSFAKPFRLGYREFEGIIDRLLDYEGRLDVVNLSGGEPALHPDLEGFLRLAGKKGIMQTTVSTNGLRFLSDPELLRVFRETGALAALQFDGFRPDTCVQLRGRDLTAEKRAIIDLLEREDVRYSLVMTVVKGVNDDEIPEVADFFFRSGAVSLMLQPVAMTGKAQSFAAGEKPTIPDLVHALEESRFVTPGDFNPLPCSHFSCFALAYYFILDNGRFLNLREFLGKEDYLRVIANRALPGLDGEGFDLIRNRLYDVWSLADAGSLGEQALKRIRKVLTEAGGAGFTPAKAFALGAESMKAVFIHDFMDIHTFDFSRLIKCCNPYPQPDGRLVPICGWNVLFQENIHG